MFTTQTLLVAVPAISAGLFLLLAIRELANAIRTGRRGDHMRASLQSTAAFTMAMTAYVLGMLTLALGLLLGSGGK